MRSNLQVHPRVGIGVLVVKDNKILLGERIHSHGSGTWCPPGGHLEFGETPQDCAARELMEETSLIAEELIPGPWTNDFFEPEQKHYVSLYMIVPQFRGTLVVKEPEKCRRWEWFAYQQLPSPLFLALRNLMKEYSLYDLLSQDSVFRPSFSLR